MELKDRLQEVFPQHAERGFKASLAALLKISEPSVNDWFSGKTKSIKRRYADALVAGPAAGWSAAWIADGFLPKQAAVTTQPPSTPLADENGNLPIIREYVGTGGAMGHGFNLTDNPPGYIKSWRVDHEWLRINVPVHTGLRNLAIVTGFGPSMRPMFNPGDPLLVDTGVKVVDHEGVYFFRVGDEGFIKLIQRVPQFDGPGIILRVISKNPDFPPYDLSPKNPHFEVLGKVLTVWRSEQF